MNVASASEPLLAAFTEAHRRACQAGRPILASVAVPAHLPSLTDLFSYWHDKREDAFYWHAHEPELTLCGCGRAATLRADGDQRFTDLAHQWEGLLRDAVVSGPRPPLAVGGFRFDAKRTGDEHWREFPSAELPLPRIALFDDARGHHVLWQQLVDADDDPAIEARACIFDLESLRDTREGNGSIPPLARTTELSQRHWEQKVDDALVRIHAGDFIKVVLAREVCQHHTAEIASVEVLRRLEAQAQGAHVFAFGRGESCFLGATPERLVRVSEHVVHTHALAGSIGRGHTEPADQAFAQSLMDSAKDRHEHALVVDAIVDALLPKTSGLTKPTAPHIKRLPRIQHLCTPINGLLLPEIGILETVAAIHPTPAVAGLPREAALEHIREHEGFDRGWYAAPVGWIDGNGDGDFLVAIRSALIDGARSYIYAGCGIVENSDPASEFRESCLKLSAMEAALT